MHYLRWARCRLERLEERRGVPTEDGASFLSVLALMISQAGQAMYAVLAMFLALVPAATILLRMAHFFVDRLIDVLSARTNWDLFIRALCLVLQTVSLYFVSKFLLTAIFIPIFSMQATIGTKLLYSVLRVY
ncbi:hypothetical protein AAG570_010209 [Ranatra chinensis]|uniref:Uncharacterized protein n=1 Tax=Ranatra chinensis TaxID=642074 RepID=A0ABD0YY06_9HEMI